MKLIRFFSILPYRHRLKRFLKNGLSFLRNSCLLTEMLCWFFEASKRNLFEFIVLKLVFSHLWDNINTGGMLLSIYLSNLWHIERRCTLKIFRPDGKCNISGPQIRAVREEIGLSQEQLAAKIQLNGLNITQKAISRMETGARVVADYELIYLAQALKITVDELLGLDRR